METSFEKLEQVHRLVARERVMNDVKTLARDAEDLLKTTAGDLSDKGKELRARLSSTLERAKAACTELQAQAFGSGKAAMKRADTTIRDHPYESIGMAFGIGLLIGALASRK